MTQPLHGVTTKTALFLVPCGLFLAAMLLGSTGSILVPRSTAQEARVVPPPALDQTAAQATASQVAILAGGCFWGVQGVFQHLKGVGNAVSGYAGGEKVAA